MQLKGKTSVVGRVGLLIPLILIILTAADSAFACPGHKSGVAYRTRAINTKTVSRMPATVISYRAPASYRRCANSLYDTRGAKYVAVRSSGTRYVAVRNDDSFSKLRRARYVAVRNVDLNDDLRYVAVRRDVRRADAGMRYVAVRSGYRRGNGIVAYIDTDTPRYVAVRRVVPRTRYIAVRDIDIDEDEPRYVAIRTVAPRTRYVAVRNSDSGCARVVALRSCLDQVETRSAKHVVLRDDDDDPVSTKYVALRDESDDDEYILTNDSDDDEAYIAVSNDRPKYVEYRAATYSDTPVALGTRVISYAADDNDLDDQAFLHDDGATFVATDDMEDACLSSHVVSTRAVSYVPVDDVDEDVSFVGNGTTYIETVNAAPKVRYVALNEVDGDAETVSYVPVEDVDTDTVSYIPADDAKVEAVSYVPVNDIDEVDVRHVAADACAMSVSNVDLEPVDVADTSTVLVGEVDSTQQIAGEFGYRDGFEDGKEAALEGDVYHPENSGDYEKATEGYEDIFGDKDDYKDGYRSSYLDGYRAGFESVDGSA